MWPNGYTDSFVSKKARVSALCVVGIQYPSADEMLRITALFHQGLGDFKALECTEWSRDYRYMS